MYVCVYIYICMYVYYVCVGMHVCMYVYRTYETFGRDELDRRRIEQQQLRHSRTFSSARAGICLASTSIWHDQRINPARIFPSARSSSGWRLPGMRFYRFVDPCPSRRRSCICMSTSTLPAYKASIEKHTDWTGRPSFSNATLPRPGTPSWNFRELWNNKASYNTCVPLMFSFACCFYINISRGHLGNRISLRPYHLAFNAVFQSSSSWIMVGLHLGGQ